jgi:chaperonin GroEL (HSP60 family)
MAIASALTILMLPRAIGQASAIRVHFCRREGLKAVASGRNPMDIKRGIDKAVLVTTTERL